MEKVKDSYKQIFKSTSIVGGSQVLVIIIGILRVKVLALLLGPAGVGIAGIYQSMIELIRNATGFGINFSGVKNVAESNNSADSQRIARTITILRRWAIATGLLGLLVTVIFSKALSYYSFGNSSYTISIAIISVVLLIMDVSSSQLALLQGLRKIGQMAKASLIGAALGTVITLPLYWWLGLSGIIPGIILTALTALFVSWFYARKVIIEKVDMSLFQTLKEGLDMAKLGFFIVVNGFIATAVMYGIRTFIRSNAGIESVGYFQSVWTISTFYINILLGAMLADYFPRLSMLNNDDEASNKLVNQQLEMTLLVGTPMLVGMITFSSFALSIMYSSSFYSAIPVLKWQMLASFLTLIGWPLGVIYLAKNRGMYAVVGESLRQFIYISFVFVGWKYFGFDSLGIGFLLANCVSIVYVILSVRRISTFRFTDINIKYIFIFSILITLVLYCSFHLEGIIQYVMNISILIALSLYCLFRLDELIDIKSRFKSSKTL
jgi:antigen flippase